MNGLRRPRLKIPLAGLAALLDEHVDPHPREAGRQAGDEGQHRAFQRGVRVVPADGRHDDDQLIMAEESPPVLKEAPVAFQLPAGAQNAVNPDYIDKNGPRPHDAHRPRQRAGGVEREPSGDNQDNGERNIHDGEAGSPCCVPLRHLKGHFRHVIDLTTGLRLITALAWNQGGLCVRDDVATSVWPARPTLRRANTIDGHAVKPPCWPNIRTRSARQPSHKIGASPGYESGELSPSRWVARYNNRLVAA